MASLSPLSNLSLSAIPPAPSLSLLPGVAARREWLWPSGEKSIFFEAEEE
jgi:hypothetical protein